MTFSPAWEQMYSRGHASFCGINPVVEKLFNSLISQDPKQRVLELGCGRGYNAAWVAPRQYYGIDGSDVAITNLIKDYPHLEENVAVADFTKAQPFEGPFDVVFDRASLSHNSVDAIRSAIRLAHQSLGKGGIYIGCDWFSTNHSEMTRGDTEGKYSRSGYPDGQFDGAGLVTFVDEVLLVDIFRDLFDPIMLRERKETRPAPGGFLNAISNPRHQSSAFNDTDYTSALWDFFVRKK